MIFIVTHHIQEANSDILSCVDNITMANRDKNTQEQCPCDSKIIDLIPDDELKNHDGFTTKKDDEITSDEISSFLSKIQNKYSGNAEQKHLNQLYDIGILCVNKSFNHQKLVEKLTKIIEDRSQDPLKKIRDHKRSSLIAAFKKGIEDGLSDDYRLAYDSSNRYQYDSDKLKKRAHINSILDNF